MDLCISMHSDSCTSCLDRVSSQPLLLSPMISNTCFAEGRKNDNEEPPPFKTIVKTEDGSKTRDSTNTIAMAKKHTCKNEDSKQR